MCGIIGIIHANKDKFVNQFLVDGLTILQHRGQDSAGIATIHDNHYHVYKNKGTVADVFNEDNIASLKGHIGIGHVRYSTLETSDILEAQPFHTNVPFGISIVHNGNLTNTDELMQFMIQHNRYINSVSDSELLLNIFADEFTQSRTQSTSSDIAHRIFQSVSSIMQKCKGGFSVILMINRVGLVAFRDPNGIRPLCFGNTTENECPDFIIASESIAMDIMDSPRFSLVRNILPGECLFIDMECNIQHQIVGNNSGLRPCLFEYIYFARPDSIIDGISVYESRKRMGQKLANRILLEFQKKKSMDEISGSHTSFNALLDIDVVIPVPETSRITALEISNRLRIPYQEGFIKNRYIARTFILPGQEVRKKSLKLKINTIKTIFLNKNVLIVDDSIVRGTTSLQLVQLAKNAGAKKIYFSSAAPPVKYQNIYGINIPTTQELIANNKTPDEIAEILGVTRVIYNTLEDVVDACRESSVLTGPTQFECSCFDGNYITGNITKEYLENLQRERT
jgi:amidophosphoribosyltransferase